MEADQIPNTEKNTNTDLPPNNPGVETQPPTSSSTPTKSNKKLVIIAFAVALLFISLTVSGYLYLKNQKLRNINEADSSTTTPSEINKTNTNEAPIYTPPNDWKIHTSSVFRYSFRYPANWEFNGYNEEDYSVAYGANTLSSINSEESEKYMDHGLMDWKSFLGDKPAIKIDFSVISKSRHNLASLEDGLSNLTSGATLITPSELKIGHLDTLHYRNENPSTNLVTETNSFIAYIDDDRAIYINLIFSNVDSYEQLTKSDDWQILQQILSTFVFFEPNTNRVFLFYHDNSLDPDNESCEANNYEIHTLPDPNSTSKVKDTVELLISSGLMNNPPEFKLVDLKQNNGLLIIEFSEVPGYTAGGSCHVLSLRSQVEKTVKQFPDVKAVIYQPPNMFEP